MRIVHPQERTSAMLAFTYTNAVIDLPLERKVL